MPAGQQWGFNAQNSAGAQNNELSPQSEVGPAIPELWDSTPSLLSVMEVGMLGSGILWCSLMLSFRH